MSRPITYVAFFAVVLSLLPTSRAQVVLSPNVDAFETEPPTYVDLPALPPGFFGFVNSTASDPLPSIAPFALTGHPYPTPFGVPDPFPADELTFEVEWPGKHGNSVGPDLAHKVQGNVKWIIPTPPYNFDTVVSRNSSATFNPPSDEQTVDVEFKWLSLKSVAPIEVKYGQEPSKWYDVHVGLSETMPQVEGRMQLFGSVDQGTVWGDAVLGCVGDPVDSAFDGGDFQFLENNPDALGLPVFYQLLFINSADPNDVFGVDDPAGLNGVMTTSVFHNGGGMFEITPEPTVRMWDNQGSTGDGNWATAANWNPDQVPDVNSHVTIGVLGSAVVDLPGQKAKRVCVDDFGTLHFEEGGELTVAQDLRLNNGTLSGSGTVRTTTGRVRAGSGRLGGSVKFGRVLPTGSTAVLATGDITFGVAGSLLIQLSGKTSGRLDVSGELDLGAAPDRKAQWLMLDWIPSGPESKFGGEYVVATYETLIGEFQNVSGDPLFPYGIKHPYVAGVDYGDGTDDQITVSLHALLDGDVDFDGMVGLDDWDTFRNNFGRSETDWTHGNFDPWDNSVVDLNDWDRFRNNFGRTVPAAGSAAMNVPEPGTLVMLLSVGLSGVGVLARRRRQGAG